jgi:hypothetical protein
MSAYMRRLAHKPTPCNECGTFFNSEESLRGHVRAVHQATQPLSESPAPSANQPEQVTSAAAAATMDPELWAFWHSLIPHDDGIEEQH